MSRKAVFSCRLLVIKAETNLQQQRENLKKDLQVETPKTVQEYADANNLTLAQARKELIDKGVSYKIQHHLKILRVEMELLGVTKLCI